MKNRHIILKISVCNIIVFCASMAISSADPVQVNVGRRTILVRKGNDPSAGKMDAFFTFYQTAGAATQVYP